MTMPPRRSVRVPGILSALVALGAASAIAPTPLLPTASSQSAKPIVVAMNFSPASLNPTVGNIGWNLMQMGAAETLVRVGRDGTIEPWIARGYRQVDRRTWDIDIRAGVTFHDGTKVDAAAVAASLRNSVARLPNAAALLDLDSATASDADTVRLTTKVPNPALWHNLAHLHTVIHDASQSADDAATKPNLTGAYRVGAFRKDVSLSLTRNASYWDTPAKAERVEVRFLPDANTRTASLLSGGVDLAYQIPVQAVDAVRRAGLTVTSVETGYLYFLLLNTARPQFADAATRRAIAHAIDRETLTRTVMGSTATAADGAISALFPFGLNDGGTQFDLRIANRLLDIAGWERRGDGVRERRGVRLAATLLTYPQRPDLTPLAVALQSQWRQIGFDVEIRSSNDINGDLNRGFDIAMYAQNTAATGDPAAFLNAHFRPGGVNNWAKYNDPYVTRLLDDLDSTADPSVRNAKAKVIQTVVRDDAPEIPLLLPQFNIGLSKRLASYRPFPSDYYVVTNELAAA